MPAPVATESLIAQALAGAESAFGVLIERYSVPLQLFARRRGHGILGPDYGEDDIFQSTVWLAWELLPRFENRGAGSFYRWLLALALNVMRNRRHYLAAKGRHLEIPFRDLSSTRAAEGFGAIAASTSIVSGSARREELARMESALDRLEPGAKAIVELAYLQGLPLRRVSTKLGLSKSTVWDRLAAAMLELRRASAGAQP